MSKSRKSKNAIRVVLICIIVPVMIAIVYLGSIPQKYNLSVGSVSNLDISAPRSVVDTYETEKKALLAIESVQPIYVRSETVAEESVNRVYRFFDEVGDLRDENTRDDGTYIDSFASLSSRLKLLIRDSFGIELTDDEAFQLVTSSSELFYEIRANSIVIAKSLMVDNLDDIMLKDAIDLKTSVISDSETTYYISVRDLVRSILSQLMSPNIEPDAVATEAARDAAYDAAMMNAVMVEKGYRIINVGEVVTEREYQVLRDLNLLETDQFDYLLLIGIIFYTLILLVVLSLYLIQVKPIIMSNPKDLIAVSLSFLLPVLASLYLKDISSLISTVYFSAVILATYMGIQSGIVMCFLQILIIAPIYNFDVEYILVSVIGIFICSVIAGRKTRKFNSATLIIFTAFACFASSVAYNLVLKSPRSVLFTSALWAIISSTTSVIAAIGSMPIFELISNTVSPVRLIDLSQPGNPLLKRLFLEAPGTSQHSMMVANLADSGADAIGADALLAKVGAYYHDIGKLENPTYFSENQQEGYNPHNDISPEESMSIIAAHADQGVRLARKNRLPNSIVQIIQEHHGTTCQIFFYHKAKSLAVKKGMPEPSINDFRYKGGIPSSKESAVVMLADTCEAALRSTGITNLDDAEDLFRKLFKQKIEQDQLNDSGLSFNDLETILRAFLQVYAGFFHERVRYPDDSTVRQ